MVAAVKVGITGSHGLIGSALAESLRTDGHDTIPLPRPTNSVDPALLEGLDAVVNLAGAGIGDKRWSDAYRQELRDSRIIGTTNLAKALAGLDRPPRVLVSASGITYYGDRGDQILTEETPPGEGFLADLVVRWEGATAAAKRAGIRVAHIRSGIVLSKHGGALRKTLPLFRFGLGGRLGSGRQWWSWISLPDEVDAIRFLIKSDIAGPVNLVAPEPVTNAAYTKAIGRVLGRPTFLAVPKFAPKLLLGRQMAEELLFFSLRARPKVLEHERFGFRHRDVESALRAALT